MDVISSWISPKARKGISSRIAGRGLFATEQISAGERFLPTDHRRARLAATRPAAQVPRVLLVVSPAENRRNARWRRHTVIPGGLDHTQIAS
jgi:hypothetical protein